MFMIRKIKIKRGKIKTVDYPTQNSNKIKAP